MGTTKFYASSQAFSNWTDADLAGPTTHTGDTDWTDTGASIAVTVPTGETHTYVVAVYTEIKTSNASFAGSFRVDIDGTTQAMTSNETSTTSKARTVQRDFSLAAGAHTIKMQFMIASAAQTVTLEESHLSVWRVE